MQTRAKKSFGQHFLKDEQIAHRIASSLSLDDSYDHIVEVGPGKGMLTQFLTGMGKDLTLIEADQDMVAYLHKHLPEVSEHIVQEDFLKVALDRVVDAPSFALIGNFPYNISSQIVFHMIRYRELIPEMVGMFQKEMAQRIVAEPGTKAYGVISVLTQAFYDGEYLFSVSPHAFLPPPRVKSGVIRLRRKPPDSLGCEYKVFRRVVKQAFSQRRKMLRNTMKTFIKGDELLKMKFFEKRPEQLSLSDFVRLTNWIAEREQNNGKI